MEIKKQNNKTAGNAAEFELMKTLKDSGFWVHKLKENQNGAPFDVIACKDGRVFAFEVKAISKGNKFMLSRVEDNQRMALKFWEETGNKNFYFAFKMINEWRFWLGSEIISVLSQDVSSIDITYGRCSFALQEVIGV